MNSDSGLSVDTVSFQFSIELDRLSIIAFGDGLWRIAAMREAGRDD